jgi:putative transposase
MPRRARLALPNVPLHLIQRGNNHQACFFTDEDYRFYLDWLSEHAGKAGCETFRRGKTTPVGGGPNVRSARRSIFIQSIGPNGRPAFAVEAPESPISP